ncbi:MAG: cryptochrome/photolyase family protein [Deltaproteobacteria bacterium]|nr:cryptochrome/photolyase family protein [Deltaproteobacteria bacterium]
MTTLHFLGPWDLDRRLPCMPRHPHDGPIVLIESRAKSSALPYHRQKLVLVLSAMHHFAEALRADGFDVEIVNARSYVDGLREVTSRRRPERVVAMRPREWGMERALRIARKENALGVPFELFDDGGEGSHFLLTREEIHRWVEGRAVLRMEHFYAHLRKKTGWLMDASGKPLGGKLSFDADNREPPGDERPPPALVHAPDAITRACMERVRSWGHGWGELEGFDWPVTREAALAEIDHFFAQRAALFGRYQDAMITGERFLWHTRIAPAMNLGLVSPREVCQRIVHEHARGTMPLAAAEGLLRQILGWREYVRAMYWTRMPAMRRANALGAERALPVFYWEPERTQMRCMREVVGQVKATGYAHHIQRLMVLGNFALLAGVEPLALSHWFWAGFVDAYEWVELPNVHGMALFADDGFTTKPYAASGAYVDRMSDHCEGCHFRVKERHGERACPFNPLFWDFLVRHRDRFASHPRIGALYRTWDRFGDDERARILESAAQVLASLTPTDHAWRFEDDRC